MRCFAAILREFAMVHNIVTVGRFHGRLTTVAP